MSHSNQPKQYYFHLLTGPPFIFLRRVLLTLIPRAFSITDARNFLKTMWVLIVVMNIVWQILYSTPISNPAPPLALNNSQINTSNKIDYFVGFALLLCGLGEPNWTIILWVTYIFLAKNHLLLWWCVSQITKDFIQATSDITTEKRDAGRSRCTRSTEERSSDGGLTISPEPCFFART